MGGWVGGRVGGWAGAGGDVHARWLVHGICIALCGRLLSCSLLNANGCLACSRAALLQAVHLALQCLSFDFVGTCLDESSEDLGTIQVPSGGWAGCCSPGRQLRPPCCACCGCHMLLPRIAPGRLERHPTSLHRRCCCCCLCFPPRLPTASLPASQLLPSPPLHCSLAPLH